MNNERNPKTHKSGWQLFGWLFGNDAGWGKITAYFHNKMGNSPVSLHLQNLRKGVSLWIYRAPPSQNDLLLRSFSVGRFVTAAPEAHGIINLKCAQNVGHPCPDTVQFKNRHRSG